MDTGAWYENPVQLTNGLSGTLRSHLSFLLNAYASPVVRQVNNTDPTKPPLKLKFAYISGYRPRKKCQKEPVNGFGLDF